MNIQFLIHVMELILSFIYIVLIWPVYEGEDYLWGCFISISYLVIIASYSIIRSLLPVMKIACDVFVKTVCTWKQILLDNIPWCSFALLVFFVFRDSLGCYACLPIVIPNGIYLLYLHIKVKRGAIDRNMVESGHND